MLSTRAAIRYATAILDTAHSKGVALEVNKDMTLIASTIKDNPDLNIFLQNPVTKIDAKRSVLLEIFENVHSVTNSLFSLLFENKRFEILRDVATEYNRLFDKMNGIEIAKVTTAVPMDADMEAKVLSKILTFSNKKIVIKNIVDPSIIGGFILRIGDQQYNASLAGRLQILKRELSN